MRSRKTHAALVACSLAVLVVAMVPALVWAEDLLGTVKSVDVRGRRFVLTTKSGDQDVVVRVNEWTPLGGDGKAFTDLAKLKPGTPVRVTNSVVASEVTLNPEKMTGPVSKSERSVLGEFWYNFRHNLFKPLLLFFYLGFVIVRAEGAVRDPLRGLPGPDDVPTPRHRLARRRGAGRHQVEHARPGPGVHVHGLRAQLRDRSDRLRDPPGGDASAGGRSGDGGGVLRLRTLPVPSSPASAFSQPRTSNTTPSCP